MRFKNSMKNSFWGAFSNLFCTLLNFCVRTIFIKTLGNEYLGINGLFTNILYILSFAELGVGHAITYSMYKPVANNDKEKVKSLLNLYRKFYQRIGCSIFGLGILIIPLLPFIIKESPNISENLILIYILYLFETAGSYFFSYKKSIAIVYQKDYICDVIKLVLSIIKSILQIIVLFVFNNYILYLVIYVLSTIFTNIVISKIVNKKYPYILDKNIKPLPDKEKKDIISSIKSLILYKIGRVSLSGTDNIIISALIGLSAVGLYSNYSLIITAIGGITYIILKGTISSVGNINATESIETKEKTMFQLLFISTWLYGFICICLVILLNPFIFIWIGNEYLLGINIIGASIFYILIDGLEFASHTYISTLGFFKQTRYSSLICAILNIILSLILGYKFGLFGIFLASSISKILTTSWFDTYVIYRDEFKKSPLKYYLRHLMLIISVCINFICCYFITNLIVGNSIMTFIFKTFITILLCNLIFILMFAHTSEFKNIYFKLLKRSKNNE